MTPSPTPLKGRSLRFKVVTGFGLALVMSGLAAVASYHVVRIVEKTVASLNQTWRIVEADAHLSQHLAAAECTALLVMADGTMEQRAHFTVASRDAVRALGHLEQSVASGSFAEQDSVRRLEPLVLSKLQLLANVTSLPHGVAPPPDFPPSAERLRLQVATVLSDLQASEQEGLLGASRDISSVCGSAIIVIIVTLLVTMAIVALSALFILRDIRARRKIEATLERERNLLSSLVDAMPNIVFVKDEGGRYVLTNLAHRQFLAVDRKEDVEGKTVFDFFPPEMARQFQADDNLVLQTGRPVLNRQEPTFNKSGKFMWRSTSKVPLHDARDHNSWLVCISTDITEQKETEEKLRLFAGRLERSNGELQEFASVASHDLQEPLRKIQAFGDRLKLKCAPALGEQGRDYLERMQNAAARMRTLIGDLLILSRVTSKAQPFLQVDLGGVVREVVSDLEVRIESCEARVEVGFLPTIDADPSQMRQLFQNLISNALKFQRPGERPEVSISSKILAVHETSLPALLPGDKVCQIMVQDNGIGFDRQFAESIFILFQRLHSRSEYEGTGIGLAVCRKITDRHGGNIMAKSADGEGATFIVTLPVEHPRDRDV